MMINPVLGREIKERMRSRRAVVMLIAFLTLLAVILYLTYRGGLMMMDDRFSPFAGNTASLGRVMFEWLLFFLVMFVAFIAPGVAAGSIVGERERQTLHPLQVTLLTPRSIVLGKLGASMAYVTLLVVATAPLFAVPLVLGGVSPWQVLRGFVVILALEIALASMAIYMSAVAKRVQFAIVAAYGLALLLLVGTVVIFGAEVLWRSQQTPNADVSQEALSVYLNPVVAMADAVTDTAGTSLPTPLSALGSYTRQRQLSSVERRGEVGMVGRGVVVEDFPPRGGRVPERVFVGPGSDVVIEGQPGFQGFANHQRRGSELPAIRMWMIHVAFLLWVSFGALWLASIRLRTPVVKIVSVRRKK
ncbi:MAG: ABC transporter permease subunit [Actinomycetota bacterium]|nr:ABC transporter permease subunit [Actinomycetota bacterium]